MDIRDFECVEAVAEESHFGRAAERLTMAQPALSKRIQKIEARLGVQLFERNSHGATLTDAGHELLGHVRDVLAQWRSLERAASDVRRGTRGTVRIGAVGSAFYEALPRLLSRATSLLPDIALSVVEMETPEALDGLKFGDIDLAFLRPPVAQGFDARTVWTEQLVLAVPSGSALANRAEVGVSELEREHVIFFRRDAGAAYWDRVCEMFLNAGIAFTPNETADHTSTILGLVALGSGVSVVPASARRLALPRVSYVPLRGNHPLPLAVATGPSAPSGSTRLVLETFPAHPIGPESGSATDHHSDTE